MENEKIGKKILKRIQNKERPIKKRRSQLNFFLYYFFIKIISFLLFSLIKNQSISYGKIMSIPVDLFLSLFFYQNNIIFTFFIIKKLIDSSNPSYSTQPGT
jgi:hypothetical protein